MRDAIRYLLVNPDEAEAMGKRGRVLACQRHSMERYVDTVKELLS
jgi:hypothetical protein